MIHNYDKIQNYLFLLTVFLWIGESFSGPETAEMVINKEKNEILATCELLITTKEKRYSDRLIELLPVIKESPSHICGKKLNM